MVTPSDLNQQLKFLQQVQYYAQSGTKEDLENLKDLFNSSFESIRQPCQQIQSIRQILPDSAGGLYRPDTITRLAREGIDLIGKELANLSKKSSK